MIADSRTATHIYIYIYINIYAECDVVTQRNVGTGIIDLLGADFEPCNDPSGLAWERFDLHHGHRQSSWTPPKSVSTLSPTTPARTPKPQAINYDYAMAFPRTHADVPAHPQATNVVSRFLSYPHGVAKCVWLFVFFSVCAFVFFFPPLSGSETDHSAVYQIKSECFRALDAFSRHALILQILTPSSPPSPTSLFPPSPPPLPNAPPPILGAITTGMLSTAS